MTNLSVPPHDHATTVADLAPGRYVVDPTASRVSFRTRHVFGLGGVSGTFGRVEGSVDVALPLASSSGHLTIDATGFDSAHARRDALVRSAKFLAVDEHPVVTVEFDRIDVGPGGAGRATASVTARGHAAPVTAEVSHLTSDGGGEVRATVTARVDRYAHGVTGSKGLAGRYLDLTLELVARAQA